MNGLNLLRQKKLDLVDLSKHLSVLTDPLLMSQEEVLSNRQLIKLFEKARVDPNFSFQSGYQAKSLGISPAKTFVNNKKSS